MIKELRKHSRSYLVLFAILAAFITCFVLAWPNVLLQRALVLFLGSFLQRRGPLLSRANIPGSVIGGLFFARSLVMVPVVSRFTFRRRPDDAERIPGLDV